MEINEKMFSLIDGKIRTEAQLAKYLGLTTGQISTWKKRKTDPPAKYIARICEYLDVPLTYLLGETKNTYSHLTKKEIEFLNIIRSLNSEDEQSRLIGYIEGYVKGLSAHSYSECDFKQEASNE
ncbi:MAG: helix-turn-helix transcriptional regulator [Clostridia bacterium]|nr:helix-turn-helix transcriptional regulator [Clostridia bacterium]